MEELKQYHLQYQHLESNNGKIEYFYNYPNNPSVQIPLLVNAINELNDTIQRLGIPLNDVEKPIPLNDVEKPIPLNDERKQKKPIIFKK